MAVPARVFHFVTYLLIRLLICVVQAMPWEAAFAAGRLLAWLTYYVNVRHRRVAAENLRHAFPHLTDRQIDKLIRRVYVHFALMVIEIMTLPRKLRLSNHMRFFRYAVTEDYYRSHALFKSGRPLIVVTGHFGNWEVFNYICGLLRYNADVVARKLDNPWLDSLVKQLRANTGQRVLDKNTDYDKITQAMSSGKPLGTLGDQDAGPGGLFVDFFGRPASTHKAIALLSLQYQAPIVFITCARVAEPMFYHLYLDDVIFPEEYDDDPDAIRSITQRYTTALENRIREFPEQYFWLHRRWKSSPGRKRKRRKKKARTAA